MKKLSIIFTALIAVSLLLVSWNNAVKVDGAVHIGPITCGVFDGDGNITLAEGNAVITPSGNGNLRCQVSGVANSTGKAVVYNFESVGILCNTPAGATDQWHETVSAKGNATLQCKYHPE